MKTLTELLLAQDRHEQLAARIARHIEAHVAQRPGLRGVAFRAGLKGLKAIRADALPRAVFRLLPLCTDALEPLHRRARAEGEEFSAFLKGHADDAADALMAVIDARAESGSHAALRRLYRGLRGSIEDEMREVLPDFAAVLSTE